MVDEGGTSMVPAGVRGLGTVELVELVEPESAVVDRGGFAWQESAVHAKLYGEAVRIGRTLDAVKHRLYHCGGTAGVLAVYASGSVTLLVPVYVSEATEWCSQKMY